MNKFNPTCLVTGKKDNLKMHAVRNEKGDMIGWVFLHESVEFETSDVKIDWGFKASIQK
jgi:hypothetical protein